ncbi:glucan biosynthesis protein D [uncultured Rhodoblastus sp.]|uniref:glucan biosynthesis protein n=1 Tax=uncultured Rhodoblastus sp. TaxID=543037 RepID=UPI0025CE9D11|nr:glucan biosynthesis protein D [uncultured Rhodoblastus sp.]
MPNPVDRRHFCQSLTFAAAAGIVAGGSGAVAATPGLKYGPVAPFSFDALKAEAKKLVGQPFEPRVSADKELIEKLDYDVWGKIHYKPDFALYAEGPERFPVEFYHLGLFFKKPVRMFRVDGSQSREILYDPSYFDMPADSLARKLPANAGFAGFRVHEPKGGPIDWRKDGGADWASFLGASYFRTIGEFHQPGLSARGVALDTWVAGRNEEFPDFTRVYIGPETEDGVIVHALLEGPAIVGAFRFLMRRLKHVEIDVDSQLFLRGSIVRFGVAPLTSMYWFSETRKPEGADWRPEVHDSDGLALWTGAGERLWRPLNNPPRVMASAFVDNNIKGFGLSQRDRNFDHYLDGVRYDLRPTVWVEPKGDWGKGSIHLVEIPTDDEIYDNIVAMWVPAEPAAAGSVFDFSYRLYWQAEEPFPSGLARVVATRLGNGGQAGQPRPKGFRKFMIEFLGGGLSDLPKGTKPELEVSASRGTFGNYRFLEAAPDDVPGHWRAQFDLGNIEGKDPVELRAFLKLGDKVLSETWIFQYHPF